MNDSFSVLIINTILLLLAIYIVVTIIRSIRIVRQAEVYLVERLGKFHRTLESGIHLLIPIVDRVAAVKDLREHVVNFEPQSMITRDNVGIQIDSVVYYQVTDPVKNQYEINNPIAAIENLTATTLRNLIGELDLDQTLTSRDTVNAKLRTVLDEATDKWGIKVNRVEIKNIVPPKEIQDAMERQMRAERIRREAVLVAQGEKESNILKAEGVKQSMILEAEAQKEAQIRQAEGERQAAILRAEGEAQAILTIAEARARGERMIYEAVKAAGPTPAVVQIRSMEALEKVADGKATKIIIPSDATSMLGVIAAAKEMLSDQKEEYEKE
ncbi:MAG: putative stomatin/prohibitin-family membrane protease subunit YbbK [Candidatus Carbobacillus altaicus]|uniref:Putative stomatin/prohibitin-family membrane protease subunit YbbK n=1 Tax=Candidatus Carbonibacillus altaicus TaxID=2163959 RepID=A0A2R6XXF5_9BACL|nr:MAG: putative stomatin/prohibitin-family membrane protease subunit YbbK [Candidatus Carbobacillus altaicus]